MKKQKILLPGGAKIIGQGITGSEGSQALPWMLKYGTKVVAGVTPGKGGQEAFGVPIFNSVREAVSKTGEVTASVVYVPPLFAKAAVIEAIEAGIKWILVVTEKIPTADTAYFYSLARRNGVRVIGPSSAGIISPKNRIKVGSIGGPEPERSYVPGNIAVLSKSGSMTSEISLHLKKNGLGVSWAVCIGGDRIIGTDFADLLLELEKDPDTKASVMFGEPGGTYEEKVADLKAGGKLKKPAVAFIGGEFTVSLPSEVQFGHAGAIIEGKTGLPSEKRKVLRSAGIKVADNVDEIAGLIKQG